MKDEEKPEEMLEYVEIYATSVESPEKKDKRSKKARELYKYLSNNKEGLLPYDKRGITIPKPRESLIYKRMGVQESQQGVFGVPKYRVNILVKNKWKSCQ